MICALLRIDRLRGKQIRNSVNGSVLIELSLKYIITGFVFTSVSFSTRYLSFYIYSHGEGVMHEVW